MIVLVVLLGIGIEHGATSQTVNTNVGTIEGISANVLLRQGEYTVNKYLGIPYAKPPVGELRFAKPVPADKFTTPYQATNYGNVCPQNPYPGLSEYDTATMSEDCLHLNVFVPDQTPDSPTGHAVMIWIHGGGFSIGSNTEYSANTLASFGNVIVVTIQYRLGFFGFARDVGSNAPGNVGLWDQHLALKWVNQNIGAFGGDNNRVTILGESAGGISVGYQSLFPQNKGLFQRGIQQSGNAAMAVSYREDVITPTTFLAERLNCTTADSEQMITCLKSVNFKVILATIMDIVNEGDEYKIEFQPTLDNDFFKISPVTAMRNAFDGKDVSEEVEFFRSLDIITGANSHEGGLVAVAWLKSDNVDELQISREEMNTQHIPFGALVRLGPNVAQEIMDMINAEYTNWESPDNPIYLRDEYVQLMGDIIIVAPSVESSSVHSNTSHANSYQYMFHPRPSNTLLPTPKWVEGANHGDEIGFVFGFDDEMVKILRKLLGKKQPDVQDWEMSLAATVMTYWTNFAKTGNPNKPSPVSVEWPTYSPDTKQYLSFDKGPDGVTSQQYLSARRANFWLKIVPSMMEAINNAKDLSSTVSKQAQDTCSKDGDCGNL